MLRYTSNLETSAQKAKGAKNSRAETRAKLTKLSMEIKVVQKSLAATANALKKKRTLVAESKGLVTKTKASAAADAERASTRVKDVIGALYTTAEQRRKEYDQKKSTSLSSAWVQSFQGVTSSVKKSIWHRMHRRKQQIILRPSEESLVDELRASVAHAVAPKFNGLSKEEKQAAVEQEMLKAEQRFLIAAHPLGDANISTIPSSKSSDDWAEPGWHLNLEVPEDYDASRILPCAKVFPVLQKNLAEIASAPGRQAASLLRASHMRCLSSPLSVFGVASSPAETNSALPSTSTLTSVRYVILFNTK